MSNLLDYIRWRGDLSFGQAPFGEVDSLLLSMLSYVPWDALPGEPFAAPGAAPTLRSLWPGLETLSVNWGPTCEYDRQMLRLAADSRRFGGIQLAQPAREVDESMDKQFGAVTILLPERKAFISYQGTDGSIVGWRENFRLYLSGPTASQERALSYLQAVMGVQAREFSVGGHSKGGNLALYAASMAPAFLQRRITRVYNHDGPELSPQERVGEGRQRVQERISTVMPQSAVVGMLMGQPGRFELVASNAVGILQHNPYSWQVEGPAFVREAALSPSSLRLAGLYECWLAQMDQPQRERYVAAVFDTLDSSKARSMGWEAWLSLMTSPRVLGAAMQGIDLDISQGLLSAVTSLYNSARDKVSQLGQAVLPQRAEHAGEKNGENGAGPAGPAGMVRHYGQRILSRLPGGAGPRQEDGEG